MTPAQCRMGRAALDWNIGDLAAAAGVSIATISRFEGEETVPTANNLASMRRALEAEGVEFINGDAPGVRLHAKREASGDGEQPGHVRGYVGRRSTRTPKALVAA